MSGGGYLIGKALVALAHHGAPEAPPPQWGADPTGKHEYRYWNGTGWTRDVRDRDQESDAPLSIVEAYRVRRPTAFWFRDPTERHELRYWNGSAWTDLVSDQGTTSSDPVSS